MCGWLSFGRTENLQRKNSKALAPKACEGVAEAAACLKKWLGVMGEAGSVSVTENQKSVPRSVALLRHKARQPNQPESEAGKKVPLRLGICS